MQNESSSREFRQVSDRTLHHTFIALFAALIICAVTIGSLILPDRTFSDQENRSLAQAPVFSQTTLRDGSYFSDLSTYLQDQILGRDAWMTLKVMGLKLTGQQESGGVYLGKDGYLLETPTTPDQTKIDRSIDQIKQFSAMHSDLHMVMTLVPCCAAVFPELLPKGAPVRDQLSDIAYVRSQLGDTLPFVEMQTAFRNDTTSQIYYRTDHHWTSRGAYDAFQAIHWEMGIDQIVNYESLTVATDFDGTLASRSGDHSRKDTIEVYRTQGGDVPYYTYYPDSQERVPTLYRLTKLDEKDQYQVFFGGNHAVLTVRTTNDTGKSLLIFKDSYANSFVQFLLPYYDRIVLVDPRYYYDGVENLLKSEAITDVLFLYSMNTFATDGSLADVLSQSTEAGA